MIKFTRGDTYRFKFQRKDANGKIIFQRAEKMWFTVKTSAYSEKIIIQKTLENGITFSEDDGYYHIVINPIDTKKLSYIDYEYDIQIENQGNVFTLTKGVLSIEKEITFEGGD